MPPHEGLLHPREYDWRDSNVEFVGSDIDHKVKFNSAATEPAWQGVGEAPGLHVWRIEDFTVVPRPRDTYGEFHAGDSYIVLHSYQLGQPDRLGHDIFFWLGRTTTQDEAGTAAYKTVELDEYLGSVAVQHRELQAEPSDEFVALFPRIRILAGGVRSGFTHVNASDQGAQQTLTLLRIFRYPTDTRADSIMVHEVEPTWQSLDENDVFVLLQGGGKIRVWQGKDCSPIEKAKAAQVVHDMTLSKHVDIEVLSQSESRSRMVVALLGGEHASEPFRAPRPVSSRATRRSRKLWRLSDASGRLEFTLVGEDTDISKSALGSNDVFLLDAGSRIWVWQGSGASQAERAMWIKVAQSYIQEKADGFESGQDYHLVPIAKVVEGSESPAFVTAIAA